MIGADIRRGGSAARPRRRLARSSRSSATAREEIRAYWQAKVVEAQDRITCELLNLHLDGNTAIVEWEAQFDDVAQSVRKRMREVAILVFEGRLIASLREYWSSEPIGRIPQLLRSPVESSD